MTKRQIIRELTLELVESRKALESGKAERGMKAKIKRLRNAIAVINELPPQCKRCNDSTFVKNYEDKVVPCPECNSYGEQY